MIDRFSDEVHRTVAYQQVDAARMAGLETEFHVPVESGTATVTSRRTCEVRRAGIEIDRRKGPVEAKTVGVAPLSAKVYGTLRSSFTEEDHVAGAVGAVRHPAMEERVVRGVDSGKRPGRVHTVVVIEGAMTASIYGTPPGVTVDRVRGAGASRIVAKRSGAGGRHVVRCRNVRRWRRGGASYGLRQVTESALGFRRRHISLEPRRTRESLRRR